MSEECRGDCRVMTAVSNDPEMGNVEMTFREALEMYVSRTHNLEAALAAERQRVAELEADRERLVYEELTRLANWVRSGDNISRDDARDDIARGIENRLREIDAAREAVKGEVKRS